MDKRETKIVLCGIGRWGANILKTLCTREELLGFIDLSTENEQLAIDIIKQHGTGYLQDVFAFDSYKDVLMDPEVTAIMIATPIKTHHSMVMEAIKYGKDVFVEKPLCQTLSEYEEIMNCVKMNGDTSIIFVGHLMLYNPVFLQFSSLINEISSRMGEDVTEINVRRGYNMPDNIASGHIIDDLAVHDLSMLKYMYPKCELFIKEKNVSFNEAYVKFWIYTTNHYNTLYNNSRPSECRRKIEIHCTWSRCMPTKQSNMLVMSNRFFYLFDDTQIGIEKIKMYPILRNTPFFPLHNDEIAYLKSIHVPVSFDIPINTNSQQVLHCSLGNGIDASTPVKGKRTSPLEIEVDTFIEYSGDHTKKVASSFDTAQDIIRVMEYIKK